MIFNVMKTVYIPGTNYKPITRKTEDWCCGEHVISCLHNNHHEICDSLFCFHFRAMYDIVIIKMVVQYCDFAWSRIEM